MGVPLRSRRAGAAMIVLGLVAGLVAGVVAPAGGAGTGKVRVIVKYVAEDGTRIGVRMPDAYQASRPSRTVDTGPNSVQSASQRSLIARCAPSRSLAARAFSTASISSV